MACCTCEQLIAEGADTFMLGGYGDFDSLAHQTVRTLQKTHIGLTSVLVMPYLNWNIDTSEYDETIYPPLETVPFIALCYQQKESMDG